ncbi:aconitate hydratase AcnA [Chlorobium sp.]|jgi:aconitate hydratase|uniref:aconitate hydratase AcnA n=1 Tax=Chlorobium sp. TaxID=1095 RepID=UPI003C6B9B41
MMTIDPKDTLRTVQTLQGPVSCHSLPVLAENGFSGVPHLPKSIKILLESALRNCDSYAVTFEDIHALASWEPSRAGASDIAFRPSRVVLQDFTGVPSIVDLAALREACLRLGGDPERVNPLVPCDLVIDHSLQVDVAASPDALRRNLEMEFSRNRERYAFLKWGQKAFRNFRVVPPGTGIVHQVNLEYLSGVVTLDGGMAYPDSLVGTDSHTTMINALGVAGWGVGGIEAEAVMLGQPLSISLPRVTGVRLHSALPEGVTATDLVLSVTETLRRVGVVNDFVEFFGPGLDGLSLPDRATIANMAPEYGATMGYFPVDALTLDYLKMTGRKDRCDLVERYSKEQGLWREPGSDPVFSRVFELDLSLVEPSIAGPKRPQDRIPLAFAGAEWRMDMKRVYGRENSAGNGSQMEYEGSLSPALPPRLSGADAPEPALLPGHGAVVIAAITSCTNTSNPFVMIAAGLLARAARERGLAPKAWVKTSLAPGSRVVTDYLEASGLARDLDALGFSTVGYGCTTCIGNSGPLGDDISEAITRDDIIVCSVLSGNRNFEGRIHPLVKANYLASPPLVVAYALCGTIAIDVRTEPLAFDSQGAPVYLRDIWPSDDTIRQVIAGSVTTEQFGLRYGDVFRGTEEWQGIDFPDGNLYAWDPASSYIRKPPFFEGISAVPAPLEPVQGARALAVFGDSVTTDHISPAGNIRPAQPAGRYLLSLGIAREDFNSFGSRRGNHEVMIRGTFDNLRIRNRLAPGTEGGFTTWFSGDGNGAEVMSIYDAAMRYRSEGTSLVILAGRDYGMGSSRDWAAKGTLLLGVRAVIAVSFERIHRSNLVGMGVLPLEFADAESAESLGLDGSELFDIPVEECLLPGAELTVAARSGLTGQVRRFRVISRIGTRVEADYYRNGGILQSVLRRLASGM